MAYDMATYIVLYYFFAQYQIQTSLTSGIDGSQQIIVEKQK